MEPASAATTCAERTTWSTPFVVERDGRTQVIVNGTRVRSYDLATGRLIWESGGMTQNPIPVPIADGSVVYCMTGYRGQSLRALPLDGKARWCTA